MNRPQLLIAIEEKTNGRRQYPITQRAWKTDLKNQINN
jgi:hypothetical protein